ncbi:hypothetical protein L1887_10684 [Cichorium endivia]|nr:hypothetical protein L1887_10684 [Cichorium endivia]
MRAWKARIPPADALCFSGVCNLPNSCSLCNSVNDSTDHVLVSSCPFAMEPVGPTRPPPPTPKKKDNLKAKRGLDVQSLDEWEEDRVKLHPISLSKNVGSPQQI